MLSSYLVFYNSNDWSILYNSLAYSYYYSLKNYCFSYKYISFLTMLEKLKSSFTYTSLNLKWKRFDTQLVNGLVTINLFPSFDSFNLFSFEYGIKEFSDIFVFTFLESFQEFFLIADEFLKEWFHNLNFYNYSNFEYIETLNLSTYEIPQLLFHKVLHTDICSIVDDYSFYGLDDYTLRVETFSNYNLFQFLRLRYGFGSCLSNLYCTFLGVSKQLNINLLNNYWHYNLGGLYLETKVNFMDYKLASYIKSRHLFLIELNSRKGIRLLNGYPIYGQRTRSNSKTASKFPYTLQFKNILPQIY